MNPTPAANPHLLDRLASRLEDARTLEGLGPAGSAMVVSAAFRNWGGPLVWVCQDNRQAELFAENLRFFLPPDAASSALIFPGVEANPYLGLSPHPEIAQRRAVGLWTMVQDFRGVVITTVAALAKRLVSPESFLGQCVSLEMDSFFPRDHLIQMLRWMGYVREDPVGDKGEFSFRGGIVDLFSPSREYPVRIEFFGDEIESIREFDPSTQRSVQMVPACEIVPMREIVISDSDIGRWHVRAPEFWSEVRFAESLQEKLQFTENKETFNGFEYLLPLVLELKGSLLDYLPGSPAAVFFSEATELTNAFREHDGFLEEAYEDARLEGSLALPPSRLFFGSQQILESLTHRRFFHLERLAEKPEGKVESFDFRPERKYVGRFQDILKDLRAWRQKDERVIFVMPSVGKAERVEDILREYDLFARRLEGRADLETALEFPVSVIVGHLSEGIYSPSLGLHLLTEGEVFGESQLKPSARKVPPREALDRFLSDFRDLKPGDYVVHLEHGIGVFEGLKKIGVSEDTSEFVVLKYRDDARLYVPINNLDLIQKYSSAGDGKPRIDRLGGTSWEKTKTRIKSSVRELAEDLLKLYARREVAQGHAFSEDEELMQEFEESFEFEETPDQAAAIRDMKKDMESPRPMDRLICGDVGYGKTEVAMRAAFKAVNDGKQVVLLAPTTVLAFQHFNTFTERFKGFPVRIEMLSRFLDRAEQKEVLEKISHGMVDILIGTHRILSKDVELDDLGLIIVDEEQRFGVAQKERLKKLKTQVDVLTLSATPIPRTLNMSLIGMRDLSLIETPPKDRLAIQTVVMKFSRNVICSAIDLELKRRGQIFLVHNSVNTIYSMARTVQEIIPEARVGVAHGQMGEKQLEEVMLKFLNYEYDVLVSTTIIENGLDIPRANTLIVNRADRFGLSQLYQLRGRVGRSNRRAYAYLLIPSEEKLTTEARKRLAAIREFSDLGSGFRIAALDLEIRGAGNLLGAAQHGHINAVGFELYVKLLQQTIRELKGEESLPEIHSTIDLKFDIRVPEHYIDDSNLRLWLYKRVSAVSDEPGLESLKDEISDRFGHYPRSVANLFEYAHLRIRGQFLKILSMDRKASTLTLRFRDDTPVRPDRIIDRLGSKKGWAIAPGGVLTINLESRSPRELFKTVNRVLDELEELV